MGGMGGAPVKKMEVEVSLEELYSYVVTLVFHGMCTHISRGTTRSFKYERTVLTGGRRSVEYVPKTLVPL